MKKILLYIVVAIHFSSISFAIIEIDITEGNREPLPIAITEFFHESDSILEDQNIPSNIRKVIADDLERSGLFISVDENIVSNSMLDDVKRILKMFSGKVPVFFEVLCDSEEKVLLKKV